MIDMVDSGKDYSFCLGIRDEKAPRHWREAPENYSFIGHKTVLVLPGSAARGAKEANGMCKIVESMLSEKERQNVNICSLYFPAKTTFREGSCLRAMYLLDKYLLPLVSKTNKDGDLEKIDPRQAAKNMRNLVIFTHCYGSYMVEAIDIALARELKSLGYTEQEQKNIQRQLFIVHHNDISNLLGARETYSTNLYRLTKADERRKISLYNSDSFQHYLQTETLNEDEALYVKVGENERAFLVKQITQAGAREHNGAYWHDDPKSEGGAKEKRMFEALLNEAVRSSYPLNSIEDFIRHVVQQNPDLKEDFNESLTYGKEFGDEYKEYHDNIVAQAEAIREKQKNDSLREKEVKTLRPEVLLYIDKQEKMVLDYAIEENNLPLSKVLWNAVRKILPKQEVITEDRFENLSYNYRQAFESSQHYLQRFLQESRPEMFAVLAKGAEDLQRLDYTVADDKTLLTAARVYSGLSAQTGQLDKLSYYKSLIYMHARVGQMEQTEETANVNKLLEAKIFTKANAKDKAVTYKVKSYASQFGDDELLKKCRQIWNDNMPTLFHQNNTELDKK